MFRCAIISVLLGSALSAGGCAGLPQAGAPEFRRADSARACEEFFARIDEAVMDARVADTQAARITDFPYLRSDRFLASFGNAALSGAAFAAWIERLQTLAADGYRAELSNLPETTRAALSRLAPEQLNGNGLYAGLRTCSELLRDADLGDPQRRDYLRSVVRAPHEYQTWQRVAGLYPLTAMAFAWGIDRWHEELRQLYARDIAALPVAGKLIRYAPPSASPPLGAEEITLLLQRSSQNPLDIPEPSAADLQRLFETFAPVFEVDTLSEDDRLGAPTWSNGVKPVVATTRPVVYTLASHTLYKSEILLQLNYVMWFPARPQSGAFDLLGGHLDGITWRVTLTRDGKPWVYDIIHNCGCYHLFIPTQRAVVREQPKRLEEAAFVPQPAPEAAHPVLRIAHTTHYLQRVLGSPIATEPGVSYQWASYDDLRSLPAPQGTRRSLFRSDGIVPGTDRGERYFFWPMGIPHPGAMRQWGHHATAFVGRRHFDDPDLLERYFELRP